VRARERAKRNLRVLTAMTGLGATVGAGALTVELAANEAPSAVAAQPA